MAKGLARDAQSEFVRANVIIRKVCFIVYGGLLVFKLQFRADKRRLSSGVSPRFNIQTCGSHRMEEGGLESNSASHPEASH